MVLSQRLLAAQKGRAIEGFARYQTLGAAVSAQLQHTPLAIDRPGAARPSARPAPARPRRRQPTVEPAPDDVYLSNESKKVFQAATKLQKKKGDSYLGACRAGRGRRGAGCKNSKHTKATK